MKRPAPITGESFDVGTQVSARTKITRDLRVDIEKRPGWVSGAVRIPSPGEEVFCAEGAAEMVRVVGKTGTGGRLLELKMPDGRRHPFFAAAENVRVSPTAP